MIVRVQAIHAALFQRLLAPLHHGDLQVHRDGHEVHQFRLPEADAPLVHEVQDEAEAPGGDAAEVEDEGEHGGSGVDSGLLLDEGPQDGGGGAEDDLVGPEGLWVAIQFYKFGLQP